MADGAIGGDDDHVRDAGDAIVGVEDFLGAEDDGPGDVFGFEVVGHESVFAVGFAAGVDGVGLDPVHAALEAGDTEDDNVGVFVMRGEFADVGEGGDAGAAPRGPEIEDDDFAAEVREGLQAGKGAPGEVQLGSGFADEGCFGEFGFRGAVEIGDEAVGIGALLGGGEVGFEAEEEFAGLGGVTEDLGVQGGLHEEDLGDVVGFLVAVFGEEGVEDGEFGGEVGGGALAELKFFLDAGDEGLEVGGGGGGAIGGGRRRCGLRRRCDGGVGGAEGDKREGEGEEEAFHGWIFFGATERDG